MSTEKTLVSILIVNYNGGDVLDAGLTSLEKSNYPNLEIVVVDNGSTDNSVPLIEEKHKKVILVKAPTNLGFASGNNLALKSSSGKYIVLLNGDTEVEPDWLDHLVAFAEEHEDVGVLTPKVLFFEDKKTLNSAGGACDIYGFSPLRGTFDKDSRAYDTVEPVFYGHGAAMFARRSLIDKIGFLDDTYFIYHEELDFCWRVWLYGYKVYYLPQSVVYHKLQKRLFYSKEKLARRQFLVKKNRIRTLIKNHRNPFLILLSISVCLAISLAELVYYLFKRDFESPKGILEGFWWNLKVLPETLQRRREVQSLYRVPEGEVLKMMRKKPFAIDILFGMLSGKYSLPL